MNINEQDNTAQCETQVVNGQSGREEQPGGEGVPAPAEACAEVQTVGDKVAGQEGGGGSGEVGDKGAHESAGGGPGQGGVGA